MNKMGKTVKLTEGELKRIIEKIISEQQQLAVGQNFQQGQQVGQVAGQQARQAVNKAVKTGAQAVQNASVQVAKFGKQVVVTIGKVAFNVVIYGAATVFLIGKGVYKVSAAIGNALLKFLAASGKAVVSGATSIGNAALSGLKAGGIAIEKGAQFVGTQLSGLADSGMSIVKWVLNQFKQFGVAVWGSLLIGATKVKEWAGALGAWIKQQYDTIAGQIGVAFNDAVSGVKAIGSKVAGAVSTGVNAVKGAATNIANTASKYAGKAMGAIQGFLQEFFERFNSFKGVDSLTILSESVKYNGLTILL
jgi:hypothetical protein